jgi:hypothetical protein
MLVATSIIQLSPKPQGFKDDPDFVFQVASTVSDGRLVVDVFPVSIGSPPIIGTDAKPVGADRNDLAVQFGQLVQANADTGQRLIRRFHPGDTFMAGRQWRSKLKRIRESQCGRSLSFGQVNGPEETPLFSKA